MWSDVKEILKMGHVPNPAVVLADFRSTMKQIESAEMWWNEAPWPSACFQGVLRSCARIVRFPPHVCNERILTCKHFQVHPESKLSTSKGQGGIAYCAYWLVLVWFLVYRIATYHNQGKDSDGTSVTLNRSHRLVLLRHHDLTATKPTPLPRVPWIFVHYEHYESMCAISAAYHFSPVHVST